jgi:hypothetical protein
MVIRKFPWQPEVPASTESRLAANLMEISSLAAGVVDLYFALFSLSAPRSDSKNAGKNHKALWHEPASLNPTQCIQLD